MDYLITVLVLLFSLYLFHGLKLLSARRKNLPPGPTPLPIIGNLHLLGKMPHKSITNLSKTHGPIMLLRFGFQNTVVISSAATAKEVLQTQDLAFSSRSILDVHHAGDHFKSSVVFLPVGPRWRSLRKILYLNMFSGSRLDANQHIMRKKVEELVEFCRRSCQAGEPVALRLAGFRTLWNLLSNTLFSRDWIDPFSDSGSELNDLIRKLVSDSGKANSADFFPFLDKFDPQGIRRRANIYYMMALKLLNELIDERVEKRRSQVGEVNDENVIDVLLTLSEQSPEEIDRVHIQTLCLDLFGAGTDTTSSTLEWAMAEALRNPEIMRKAKEELDEVIGEGEVLDEADVTRLPYLQCIVKETLRLHPSDPFLIPRKVDQDVELCGYVVPKGSRVLVNAWAIGRDAETWADPLEFRPERFVGSDVDVRGRDFELIPFGAGRRICPGLPLAIRVVSVMLGSLLNSFDWKLEVGISPDELDMEEKFGLTMHKAVPLQAIPISL